jgi:acylpyruvate hydrolase
MKIVSFESPTGLRLGVVEGDQVVDLQAADPKVPTDLGALLAGANGDLSGIKGLAGRAPASARRPLKASNTPCRSDVRARSSASA